MFDSQTYKQVERIVDLARAKTSARLFRNKIVDIARGQSALTANEISVSAGITDGFVVWTAERKDEGDLIEKIIMML